MGRLTTTARWLDERFAELVAGSHIPGAAVAVLAGDDVVERAAGVLNVRTGVEATTDSVFQIGSITKVWTATLAMQLVEEGKLDLDQPVRTYLPDFRVADEAAGAAITPRHCLSHTSGVEGDIFTDVGRGDDVLERFVAELLPDAPQLFEPGRLFSYCNTGFIVLGRIIEVLGDQSYNEVLVERLAEPLGLQAVSPRAEDAIVHRAAVGHLKSNGEWTPATTWAAGYAGQPAGSMLAMTSRDLLGFARMHLNDGRANDGRASDGTQVIAPESVEAMRTPHVQVPPSGEQAREWGLGWALYDWSGSLVIGHDGGTIGQAAYLRMVPEHDLAIILLTNGGRPDKLFRAVLGHLLGELAGIELPAKPKPPAQPEPVDPTRYTGRYESRTARIEIEEQDGELWRVFRQLGELAEWNQSGEPHRDRIVRLDGDTFITADGGDETFTFVGDDGSGRAAFLHGGRARPRVG